MSYEARSVARLIAAALLVFLLGLPAIASAASPYDARFAHAGNVVHAYEPTIARWQHQSHISFAVSVTIAAFGLAIACLQMLGRRWTRPATLVIGALVAVLAVHTTFFDGDPRTLDAQAREGRRLIASAERFLALAPALVTDADREEALGHIQQNVEALALLYGGGSKGRSVPSAQSTSVFPSPFATLYAAGGGCACAAPDLRDGAAYRYFCGQGTARSLPDARAAAAHEALAKGSRTLRVDLSYLRTVSAEVAACPVSGNRGFTMFVLLRVPTILASAGAQQAFNPTPGNGQPF